MSLPVILTVQAQQDLSDIWRGLAEFGELKRADFLPSPSPTF